MRTKGCPIAALLLLLALLFSACNTDTGSSPTVGPGSEMYTIINTNDPIDLEADGWAKMIKHTVWPGAFSANGYYHTNQNGCLQFLDLSNGVDVPLCSKPGCSHTRNSCDGHLGIISFLFYTDGYLYYDKGDLYGDHLYRRNADGTGEEKVVTLGEQYISSKTEIHLMRIVPVGDVLYYSVEVRGVERDETGAAFVEKIYETVNRVDLNTGEDEELFRTSKSECALIAAQEDKLLYLEVMNYEFDESGSLEAMQNTPTYLKCWSEETGKSHVLLEKPYKYLTGTTMVVGGKVFCNAAREYGNYTYDLVSKTYEKAELWNGAGGLVVLNDAYIYSGRDKVFYNTQTKTSIPNELTIDMLSMYIEVTSEAAFSMKIHIRDENRTDKGKGTIFVCVRIDALADGLQDSDLMMYFKTGDV